MQNAIDNSGKTASSVACQRGHADVVKIFMQKASDLSIDLNTEDNDGITGFHHACESGDSDLVKIFMQNAADLSIDLN